MHRHRGSWRRISWNLEIISWKFLEIQCAWNDDDHCDDGPLKANEVKQRDNQEERCEKNQEITKKEERKIGREEKEPEKEDTEQKKRKTISTSLSVSLSHSLTHLGRARPQQSHRRHSTRWMCAFEQIKPQRNKTEEGKWSQADPLATCNLIRKKNG